MNTAITTGKYAATRYIDSDGGLEDIVNYMYVTKPAVELRDFPLFFIYQSNKEAVTTFSQW